MKKFKSKKLILGCFCCILFILAILSLLSSHNQAGNAKKKEPTKQNTCTLKKEYRKEEPEIDGISVSELLEPNVSKVYVNPYTKEDWKQALVSLDYGYEDVTMMDDDGYQKNPQPGTYQVTYQNNYCKNTQTYLYIVPKPQGVILEIDKHIPEIHLPSKILKKLNPNEYSYGQMAKLIYDYNDCKINAKVQKPDGSLVWEKVPLFVEVTFYGDTPKVHLGLYRQDFQSIKMDTPKELEAMIQSFMGYTYDQSDSDLQFHKDFDILAE